MSDKKEVMIEHKQENPMATETKAKIKMYEEEVALYKKIGDMDKANAIQKEVDNLKHELFRYI